MNHVRILNDLNYYEISLVLWPANPYCVIESVVTNEVPASTEVV